MNHLKFLFELFKYSRYLEPISNHIGNNKTTVFDKKCEFIFVYFT